MREDRTWRVTHGVTAVAELKPTMPSATSGGIWVTHGVTAVAELKPLGEIAKRLEVSGHQRRHRRGRIEASSSFCTRSRTPAVTHGVTAVAELKRAFGLNPRSMASWSPTASPPWPN